MPTTRKTPPSQPKPAPAPATSPAQAPEPLLPAASVVTPHPDYGHPVPSTNHLPAEGPPQDPRLGEKTPVWREWKDRNAKC